LGRFRSFANGSFRAKSGRWENASFAVLYQPDSINVRNPLKRLLDLQLLKKETHDHLKPFLQIILLNFEYFMVIPNP
jgi:hypothetical protein